MSRYLADVKDKNKNNAFYTTREIFSITNVNGYLILLHMKITRKKKIVHLLKVNYENKF